MSLRPFHSRSGAVHCRLAACHAGIQPMQAFNGRGCTPNCILGFCWQVQEEMMKAAYDDDVLCLPGCGVTVDGHEGFIWRGPRVRMGICQDLPQAIMPHSTSGRADYFGGLVNRLGALTDALHCWRHGHTHVQAAARVTCTDRNSCMSHLPHVRGAQQIHAGRMPAAGRAKILNSIS